MTANRIDEKMKIVDLTSELEKILEERVLVLDGAWGSMIQGYDLEEADYRGERFKNHPQDVKGNNDLLCITQPQIIEEIQRQYLDAGISVAAMRYRAMLFAGVLCGVAGTYLSTAQSAAFIKDMSAGKGFIALAALIFGKWRPKTTLLACLLFGFLEAASARLQGVFNVENASGAMAEFLKGLPFLIDALPFILVVLLLAGFVGTAVAPRASGIPYVKER